MRETRQQLARWGENLAAEVLSGKGYQLLGRNFFTRYGEIDLIFMDGGQVVMVEVKTRTSLAFGLPETAVTQRKAEHLRIAAEHYLQQHPELGNSWRIDVVSILRLPGKEPEVVIFENAIS